MELYLTEILQDLFSQYLLGIASSQISLKLSCWSFFRHIFLELMTRWNWMDKPQWLALLPLICRNIAVVHSPFESIYLECAQILLTRRKKLWMLKIFHLSDEDWKRVARPTSGQQVTCPILPQIQLVWDYISRERWSSSIALLGSFGKLSGTLASIGARAAGIPYFPASMSLVRHSVCIFCAHCGTV